MANSSELRIRLAIWVPGHCLSLMKHPILRSVHSDCLLSRATANNQNVPSRMAVRIFSAVSGTNIDFVLPFLIQKLPTVLLTVVLSFSYFHDEAPIPQNW